MAFNDPLPGVMRAAINRIIALNHEEQNRVARRDGYEMRVHARAFDLIAAFEELEHLVDLLGRARTFQEISLLIKVYVIGWVTLSDVLANIINEVFDLGYGEQDVQLGTILRNRKIRESTLPQVIKRHGKEVRYDRFARLRNDVVHRGKLDDAELADVRGEVLSAVVMKTMRIDATDAAAIEEATNRAAEEVEATQKMRDLVRQKQSQFAAHLAGTRAMFLEIAPVLIARIIAQPRETA